MKNSAGFTLIEVLVSVVILSTGIIFVLHAFETASVALSDMRDTIWAGNVAQSEIDMLRVQSAAGEDPGSGYRNGISSTYYSSFIWERNISSAPFDSGRDGADLRHVLLAVRRDGSTRLHKYETYIRVAKQPATGETSE